MTQWLVTGASAGIGRAVTEQLLAAGHRVAATARDAARLEDVRRSYPGAVWTADLDMTDTAAIRAVVTRAFEELGRIDVVFSMPAAARSGRRGAHRRGDRRAGRGQYDRPDPARTGGAAASAGPGRAGGSSRPPRWARRSAVRVPACTTPRSGASRASSSRSSVRSHRSASASRWSNRAAYGPGSGRAVDRRGGPRLRRHPVGQVRQFIEGSGGNLTGAAPGDPARVAAAIIASASTRPPRADWSSEATPTKPSAPPCRAVREVEAGGALAASTDFPA